MEEKNNEKQSSIKVSRNAKGVYAFEVKTYYNEDDRDGDSIVEHNKEIMESLLKEFA